MGSSSKGRPRYLPLNMITADRGIQPRAELNQEAIDDYAERIQAGDRFPPVVAFHDGNTYWLAAGFHRHAAAVQSGRKTIAVHIHEGNRSDALRYALGDNRTQGLRMTRADKQRAVELAVAEFPTESSRTIAKLIGVSHTFVERLRPKSEESGALPVATLPERAQRTGSDGRVYLPPPTRVTTPASLEPPVEIGGTDWVGLAAMDAPPEGHDGWPEPLGDEAVFAPPARPATAALPARPVLPARPTPPVRPAPVSDDEPPVDRFGTPIVREYTRDDYERAAQYRELAQQANAIKHRILNSIAANDPLCAWIPSMDIESACDRVRYIITSGMPYAVCPYCGGSGCQQCQNRGWVPKRVFDLAPADIKPNPNLARK